MCAAWRVTPFFGRHRRPGVIDPHGEIIALPVGLTALKRDGSRPWSSDAFEVVRRSGWTTDRLRALKRLVRRFAQLVGSARQPPWDALRRLCPVQTRLRVISTVGAGASPAAPPFRHGTRGCWCGRQAAGRPARDALGPWASGPPPLPFPLLSVGGVSRPDFDVRLCRWCIRTTSWPVPGAGRENEPAASWKEFRARLRHRRIGRLPNCFGLRERPPTRSQ